MMDLEWEGGGPLCRSRRVMESYRHTYWQDKELDFRSPIYFCHNHGFFIWNRREQRHELADLSKLKRRATIKPLPPELRGKIKEFDYTIVEMKCPDCEYEWKQYKETPPESWGKTVRRPGCGVDIPKDKIVKRQLS